MFKMKVKLYAAPAVLDKVQERLAPVAYKIKRERDKIKAKLRGDLQEMENFANQVASIAPGAEIKVKAD